MLPQVATAQGSEWDYVLLSTVRRKSGDAPGLLGLGHHGGTDANVIIRCGVVEKPCKHGKIGISFA